MVSHKYSYLIGIEIQQRKDGFIWSCPDADIQTSVSRILNDVEQDTALRDPEFVDVNFDLQIISKMSMI